MKNKKLPAFLIFYVGYLFLLITDVCKEINFISNNQRYITIIGYILILIYIAMNFRTNKKIQHKPTYIYIAFFIIAIISWIFTNNFTVIRLLLLVAALYTIEFDKFIKVDVAMKILLTVLLIFSPLLGIIENNYLLRQDHSVRYSFGFNHPNSLSIYIIMILFETVYIIYKNNNIKLYKIITFGIVPILVGFIYFVANSRMSALSLLVFYVLNILYYCTPEKIRVKFKKSQNIKCIVINLFGIFTLLTIFTVILSYSNIDILSKLDKIFSNRYSNYIIFINKFGISLFGTEIPVKLGYGEYLDNMYLKLLINQGVLQYILYYIIFYRSSKKAYQKNDYLYLLILSIILFEGFTETNMIMPTINIFILYFVAGNGKFELKNQINKGGEESKMVKKINLDEIHQIELEIINDIDRVCRENNIKYTIIGGTLIGAVRHKGFIPWDDDIDIAMPRKDYERFIEIYNSNKKEQFSIFEKRLNNDYYYPFVKVSDNRTCLREKNYKEIKNLGVNVDVFPIDKVSTSNLDIKLKKIEFYCKGLSKCFSKQKEVTPSILKRFLKNIIFFRDYKFYLNKIEKLAMKDNNKICDLAGVLVNGTGKKDIFSSKIFEEYTDLQFDNIKLMSVKDYEAFLKHRFGDYMKLPPKEQQVAHLNEIYWK